MDLEQALTLRPVDGTWTATVPPGWSQGRTTFGGLVAGYLARAVEADHARPIHGVDVTFLEPVPPGDVQVRIDAVREGKHLTHVEASLHARGRRSAVGRFLLADDDAGPYDEVPMAPVPQTAFDDSLVMPYIEGLTPEFTKNLQIRYGEGPIPFSGGDQASTGGFVRTLGASTGVAAMLAHIDAWPPAVLGIAHQPMAASTVRWHVLFHAPVALADGREWSWFRADAPWRHGRLATATGMLVRDGRSVAYAEQTVAMYV